MLVSLRRPQFTSSKLLRVMAAYCRKSVCINTLSPSCVPCITIHGFHEDNSKVLHVQKGGRQGCRLGGKILNLVYAAALDLARVKLRDQGITLNIHVAHDEPPWQSQCAANHAPPSSVSTIIDVKFVDDAAFFVSAVSPSLLKARLSTTIDTRYIFFCFCIQHVWLHC